MTQSIFGHMIPIQMMMTFRGFVPLQPLAATKNATTEIWSWGLRRFARTAIISLAYGTERVRILMDGG
jgi:hypothetical protein